MSDETNDFKSGHPGEEDLVLYYYGDAADSAGVEDHLAACAACREEYAGLQRTLNSVTAMPAPERGPAYEAQVWQRVQGELGLRPKRRFRWIPDVPRWAVAGALTTLVAISFFAGRWSMKPQAPANIAASPSAVRQGILLDALGDHLDRTQIALVTLENASNAQTALDRSQTEDLLQENRLYRQAARQDGEAQSAAVLEDIERLLMEMANASDSDLDSLRRRVAEQDLLFKIRVLRAQVTERERSMQKARLVRN
jgi:hypothetical protein